MTKLTSKEVAKMLRVTPKTVREMAKDGRIQRSVRVGRLYRFDPREIHELFFNTSSKGGRRPHEDMRSLKSRRELKLIPIQSLSKKGVAEWV